VEDLLTLQELESLQGSWGIDVDLGFNMFSPCLPQLLHLCWKMENDHGPVLRNSDGCAGISHPGVNVISRDLPVTGVARRQYVEIESVILAELIGA